MNNKIDAVIETYRSYRAALEALDIGELWEFESRDEYTVFPKSEHDIICRMVYLTAKLEDTSEAWDKYEGFCSNVKGAEIAFISENNDIIRAAREAGYEKAECQAKAEFDSRDYYLPHEGWLEEPGFYSEHGVDETVCPCLSREAIEKALAEKRANEPHTDWGYRTVLRWYFRPATEEEVKQRGVEK